ncbi:MAG: hypothetical protein V3S11_02855 [Elusimicrobiota bacterium]
MVMRGLEGRQRGDENENDQVGGENSGGRAAQTGTSRETFALTISTPARKLTGAGLTSRL